VDAWRSKDAPSGGQIAQGLKLYAQHCATCHGEKGEGMRTADAGLAYPPMAGNRAVTLSNPTNLARIVLHGGFAPATPQNPQPFGMPPFAQTLSDAEIATLLSAIRSSWGNDAPAVSVLEVYQAK
jgi:mono/diheme cytochrome c family protein